MLSLGVLSLGVCFVFLIAHSNCKWMPVSERTGVSMRRAFWHWYPNATFLYFIFHKIIKSLDVVFHGNNHYQHFKADRDYSVQAVLGNLPRNNTSPPSRECLYSMPHDSGSPQEIKKPWVHLPCRYLCKEQSPGQLIQPLRMGDPSYMHHQPRHVHTGSSF